MKTHRIIRFIFSRKIANLLLILLVVGTGANAQDNSKQLTPEQRKELASMKGLTPAQRQRVITAMTEKLTPVEEMRKTASDEFKKVSAITDLDQRMDAVASFVKGHPAYMTDGQGGAIYITYAIAPYIKANHDNHEKLRAKLDPIAAAFPSSASLGKSIYENELARILLEEGGILDYAASVAQASIDTFHLDEYTASERQRHEEEEQFDSKADKNYVPEPFDSEDAKVHFQQEMSARYTVLGEIEAKLGENQAALQAYTRSVELHPRFNDKGYLGLAKLEESRGNKEAALQSLEGAALTGNMDAASITHMKQLYMELHPGSNEQTLESLLDKKYKSTFHNPVTFTPYVSGSVQPSRVVLAELFTGAGCEPCMTPDLAFDADLQRYTRNELVLLVYHDNAPFADPLANSVTEERGKYYSTDGSTPHSILDGKEMNLVEGLPSHAQAAFDSLSPSIDSLLNARTDAHLEVQARRHGLNVQVVVQGSVASTQAPLVLHVDLLETEVSYSGENGLRLQPMVVRATAKQTEDGSGFQVSGRTKIKVKYTFKLQKIEAANLAYYSHFDKVVKKRTNGRFGVKYREQKNMIDPNKLAAVAFVQNDATKDVLQTAFTPVTNDGPSLPLETARVQ